MTRSSIAGFFCAAAALVVSACSGPIIYEYPGPQRAYFDGDFDYAVHKGAILTKVHGNPFAMPAEQFRDLLLAQMKDAVSGVPNDYVATRSEKTLSPYKVVAVINAPPYLSADDMCADNAETGKASPGADIRIDLAFCFGDEVKTEVAGRVSGVRDANDPKFREFVRSLTHHMIPAQDSEDVGEGQNVP